MLRGVTLAPIPASFRPGGATTPQATAPASFIAAAIEAHLKFLSAEERATATLMGFFEEARLDLETFIRQGDLTVSDATFYRQLLDETNRIGSKLNAQGAQWTSDVIPEAHSAGWRTWSSTVVPKGALEALSRDTLSLITQTTDGIRIAVRQSIAAGILQGLSGADVRARIIASGLTNIPHWPNVEYRAGVIARTETMKAYNAGALDGIVDSGARFVRWLASPDEATCKICLPRDHVVFRIGLAPDDFAGDPYPAAQPLPHLPAHPRCRCTIRAEYRGPDGKVIRATAPETDPKLPSDAMGGQDAPTLPPAAGDFRKAVGGLQDDLALWLSGDVEGTARRQFWRGLGQLDDEMLGILTSGTKAKVAAQMDSFMRLRYGITYIDKAGMTAHLRLVTLKALELIRSIDPRHVVDNPYLTRVGDKPYGAKKFGANTLARAFLTGHVEWNPSLSKQYEGQFLRMIDDGSFEVIVHEFMHSAHYRLGAYAGRYAPSPNSFETQSAIELNAEWRAIRAQSANVSPSPGAITKLRTQIASFEAGMAPDFKRVVGTDGVERDVYMGPIRNKLNLDMLKRQLELLEAAKPDHEYWPTDYAKTGDEKEDFAESATMYLLDPTRLKTWAPKRYAYMKKHVFP